MMFQQLKSEGERNIQVYTYGRMQVNVNAKETKTRKKKMEKKKKIDHEWQQNNKVSYK
jgi:hypothetical protein